MKTIKQWMLIAFLSLTLGIITTATSQENPSSRTTPAENYDDDGGNYSWIGLLGLLGLAGLLRNNRDAAATRRTTSPAQTNYTP